MVYIEVEKDLFCIGSDYFLAHCISADFALGAGIAVEFNKRYDMRNKLIERYGKNWEYMGCAAYKKEKVFNLITKKKYWQKPTLETMETALYWMKIWAIDNNVKKIAMPKIGCGLDRLKWKDVRVLIFKIFEETDIEILVCSL